MQITLIWPAAPAASPAREYELQTAAPPYLEALVGLCLTAAVFLVAPMTDFGFPPTPAAWLAAATVSTVDLARFLRVWFLLLWLPREPRPNPAAISTFYGIPSLAFLATTFLPLASSSSTYQIILH